MSKKAQQKEQLYQLLKTKSKFTLKTSRELEKILEKEVKVLIVKHEEEKITI